MKVMLMLMISSFLLTFVVLLLGKGLKIKEYLDFESSSPFECGFSVYAVAVKSFSIRFFILGVIFLIFDVELALLFPIFSHSLMFSPFSFYVIFFIFLFFLTLGYFHEWNKSKIDWLK